ncbi:MAG: hypothetical protein K0S73_374 [Stenotrophomonas rhizophila]|jgi:hypothetical protein|nr:hypothetical protein [Stenotrophomonas rhizophila]
MLRRDAYRKLLPLSSTSHLTLQLDILATGASHRMNLSIDQRPHPPCSRCLRRTSDKGNSSGVGEGSFQAKWQEEM